MRTDDRVVLFSDGREAVGYGSVVPVLSSTCASGREVAPSSLRGESVLLLMGGDPEWTIDRADDEDANMMMC